MKEIIYHVTATVAGRATFNAEAGITQNQVLGVINKTTGKVIYTPLWYSEMSMLQSTALEDGSRNYTLYFGSSLPPVAVGDNLLIKVYTDQASDLEEFFGLPSALPDEYQAMTEQEVTDTLEDIMATLDIDLNQTVEYPEGSGVYMTRAQAITPQANEIIHPNS